VLRELREAARWCRGRDPDPGPDDRPQLVSGLRRAPDPVQRFARLDGVEGQVRDRVVHDLLRLHEQRDRERLRDDVHVHEGARGEPSVLADHRREGQRGELLEEQQLRDLHDATGETWLIWNASTDNATAQSMIEYRVFINGVYDSSLVGYTRTVVYGTPFSRNTYTVIAVDASGNQSAPATIEVDNF
jgi:hypothetical protein